MKKEREKSDPSIVAKRPANKPKVSEVDLWACGTESAEPREGTEGNTGEQHTCRTPSRASVTQGLQRVREAAKQRKKERFTALLHHVTIDLLKDAYSWLKREGGIRRETVPLLAQSGADGVVPGSLVVGDPDPCAALNWIHAQRVKRSTPFNYFCFCL